MTFLLSTALSGLLFVPVEPCRIADSREATTMAFGVMAGGGYYAFLVRGDETREAFKDRGLGVPIPFTFGPGILGKRHQGGNPGGCGIPMEAKGALLHVAIKPVWPDPGHLRVWKHNIDHYDYSWGTSGVPIFSSPPKASAMNWGGMQDFETSNLVFSELCSEKSASFGDCNEDIVVRAYWMPVGIVIDVYGYYVEAKKPCGEGEVVCK